VIRRFAQQQLKGRTDLVALAQAKAEIRALVERDFKRKQTQGRKRHARFLAGHSNTPPSADERCFDVVVAQSDSCLEPNPQKAAVVPTPATDDLPLFESGLDLPRLPRVASVHHAANASDEIVQ
jgi:hypothetical protein